MENPTDPSLPPSPELEPSTPAAQPASEQPAPSAPEPESPADPLLQLARAAKAARLAPVDEERAVTLLSERLASGRAGITGALAPMLEGLPWIVCVHAVSAVWEKLSVPMRRLLLGNIAKNDSEAARRLRLSLARALFKLDPPAGLKLAAAAAASLKDPDTGALSAKHRQFFFNVFIGKGKPWLLQLPLGDLKPGEADTLVHCSFETFPLCPPLSQLSLLRWAHAGGRFKKLAEGDVETAAKAIARWNRKLQRQLKAEIPELPPSWEAAFKPEPAPGEPAEKPAQKAPAAPEEVAPESAPEAEASAEAAETPEPAAPAEELVIPGRAERLAQKEAAKEAAKHSGKAPEAPHRGERERGNGGERGRPERPEPRPERAERPAARPFDPKEALRGVENYIGTLRSELEAAKAQIRRLEKEGKRGGRAPRAPEAEFPVDTEELTRHNVRLEATIAELRGQLEDFARDAEAVAEARRLHTAEPLAENAADALKALLSIRLAEAFETYHAMRLEPLDKVFRLDYRDLLGSVFEVLQTAGVPLKKGAQ
ncbi:MAG: hypothetical protein PHQ12_06125 [Chthoniobacteraceae bacterium]|nr:hypothetical protein [Chthoniobacteraceae bacterium]